MRPIRHVLGFITAVITIVLALSACSINGANTPPRDEEKNFSYAGPQLSIAVGDFNLNLTTSNTTEVRVKRHLTGMAAEDGNASWALEGGELKLDAKCTGISPGCGASFDVAVPANIAIKAVSTAGRVTVAGLANDLTVENRDGKVHVDNASGRLQISGHSGEITGTGLRSPQVDVTSENGSIRLQFAAAPSLVNARSSHAAVTVSLPSDAPYHIKATSETDPTHVKLPNDEQSPRKITVGNQDGGPVVVQPA